MIHNFITDHTVTWRGPHGHRSAIELQASSYDGACKGKISIILDPFEESYAQKVAQEMREACRPTGCTVEGYLSGPHRAYRPGRGYATPVIELSFIDSYPEIGHVQAVCSVMERLGLMGIDNRAQVMNAIKGQLPEQPVLARAGTPAPPALAIAMR